MQGSTSFFPDDEAEQPGYDVAVMLFQTVLDLKNELRGIPKAAASGGGFVKKASPGLPTPKILGVFLGAVPGAGVHDFKLAVRTTRQDAAVTNYVKRLTLITSGEIDVQHVGEIQAIPLGPPKPPWQTRCRPLLPGYSVSHERGTAGTIGGFVRKNGDDDGPVHVLSNSHVLALWGDCAHHDKIVQPGPSDGGAEPADLVATLAEWVALAGVNYVDAALGVLEDGVDFDVLYDGKKIGTPYRPQQKIDAWKVGRTTGLTHGKVTGLAEDDVPVRFGSKVIYFDDQTEIEGNAGNFSESGDSGSLIMDGSDNPFGLLFAASTITKKTFANPILTVLQQIDATLLS